MPDPTPTPTTPPPPAKGAREVIAKTYNALESYFGAPDVLERIAQRETGASGKLTRCALALRALLDAPKGSVERLCEAADDMVVVSGLDSLQADLDVLASPREGTDAHARVQVYYAARTLKAALAAVRASPEGVGAGGVKYAAASQEATVLRRERDEALRINAALVVERDRADQASRGSEARIEEWKRQTVYQNGYREGLNDRDVYHNADKIRITKIAEDAQSEAQKAMRERDEERKLRLEALRTADLKDRQLNDVIRQRDKAWHELTEAERNKSLSVAQVADNLKSVELYRDRLIAERDALKAEFEKAQREITILRADRDRAAMPTTANAAAESRTGAFASTPPQSVMADLAAVYGTPPPASEAVASRARLLYDGAMHYIATTAAAGLQDGPEDCARIARRVLEECEKAGKGEGGKA